MRYPLRNTSDHTFREIMNSAGLYERSQIEWYDKFCRFECADPYGMVTTTREYDFITKPDLHIFSSTSGDSLNSELENIPLWKDAFLRYKDVLLQLQYSANTPTNAFMNLLFNGMKSSIDLPSISSLDVETNENIYGTHMTYRRSSLTTDEQHDFSIEFEDTKYLEIYTLFRMYDEYAKLKDLGMVTPVYESYTVNKILYDQSAAYKFIVGEDGETLIYWAKLWGVYPKTVPRDSFSDLSSLSSGLRFSVNFHATFVDDLDPTILAEFNAITLPTNTIPNSAVILPIYNKNTNHVDGTWAGLPFIVKDTDLTGAVVYKLKWRKP